MAVFPYILGSYSNSIMAMLYVADFRIQLISIKPNSYPPNETTYLELIRASTVTYNNIQFTSGTSIERHSLALKTMTGTNETSLTNHVCHQCWEFMTGTNDLRLLRLLHVFF